MGLGAPVETEMQATFYFPKAAAAAKPLDGAGVPFAPTAVSRVATKDPVRVPCGVEDPSTGDAVTSLGDFGDAIIVTLLDEDFAQVSGFAFVAIGGVRYDYARELVPRALGSVGIHRLLCTGEGSR